LIKLFSDSSPNITNSTQQWSGSNLGQRVQDEEFCKVPKVLSDRVDMLGNPLNDNLPCSLKEMQEAFKKRDGGDTLIKLSYIAARWV
jgi:hypothetical protein